MKFRILIFVLFLFKGFGPAQAADVEAPLAVFREANAAYRAGDYEKSVSLYENLVAERHGNAAVFYNLGNAHFKKKKVGRAILYYEKAKHLKPRDRDLAANLEYVQSLLEYRVEDKRNWYVKTGEALLRAFTEQEIGIVAFAFGLAFLFSWGFLLHFRPTSTWSWRMKTLLWVAVVFFSFFTAKGLYHGGVREAVVLKTKARVRYGPSNKDQIAFRLGEGIKVRIKKQTEGWSRVVLANGETGWMDQEEIGVV